MSYQDVSLNPKQLLAAIYENLDRHFFVAARHSAKQLFHVIADGKDAPFMRIDMGDAGEVICELALDTDLHVGKVNFGYFRRSLKSMMTVIKERIEADEKLNALSNKQGEIIFNVPGVIEEDGQLNVMVCSFKSMGPGRAIARLAYLDPVEYSATVQDDSQD